MSGHVKAQLLRFARATGYAFAGALLATGGNLRWWDLLTLLAGAAETGLRQVFQVEEKPMVSSQPDRPTETIPPVPPATG